MCWLLYQEKSKCSRGNQARRQRITLPHLSVLRMTTTGLAQHTALALQHVSVFLASPADAVRPNPSTNTIAQTKILAVAHIVSLRFQVFRVGPAGSIEWWTSRARVVGSRASDARRVSSLGWLTAGEVESKQEQGRSSTPTSPSGEPAHTDPAARGQRPKNTSPSGATVCIDRPGFLSLPARVSPRELELLTTGCPSSPGLAERERSRERGSRDGGQAST